jgi:hypothetical protein
MSQSSTTVDYLARGSSATGECCTRLWGRQGSSAANDLSLAGGAGALAALLYSDGRHYGGEMQRREAVEVRRKAGRSLVSGAAHRAERRVRCSTWKIKVQFIRSQTICSDTSHSSSILSPFLSRFSLVPTQLLVLEATMNCIKNAWWGENYFSQIGFLSKHITSGSLAWATPSSGLEHIDTCPPSSVLLPERFLPKLLLQCIYCMPKMRLDNNIL